MTSVKFFRKVVPIALSGVAALVMAIPMSASAGDWNRHDQIAHQAWRARHQNWFNGWHPFRPAWPAYAPAYGNARPGVIPAAPAYGVPAYANPSGRAVYETGYGPCTNLTRLQNVYRHDRATGHPLAANDVARHMHAAGNRCGGMGPIAPVGGYAYGQNGSVLAPWMGSWLGIR